jgi:hypothetical protein
LLYSEGKSSPRQLKVFPHGDCLAQASMFAALAELVTTYGEDAVAKFAEGLPSRVRNGEFSVKLAKQ